VTDDPGELTIVPPAVPQLDRRAAVARAIQQLTLLTAIAFTIQQIVAAGSAVVTFVHQVVSTFGH
jgi:hypothetical protein